MQPFRPLLAALLLATISHAVAPAQNRPAQPTLPRRPEAPVTLCTAGERVIFSAAIEAEREPRRACEKQ